MLNYSTLSYWEKESFECYDVVIIGAGLVGWHTAIQLATKEPKLKIVVLERHSIPTGASTKNAGFACMGSASELLANLQTDTPEQVASLFCKRWEGLQATRQMLGDGAIGFEQNGSYELLTHEQVATLDKIEELNTLLKPILHCNAFEIGNSIIEKNKFNSKFFAAAIQNTSEGELHTGMLNTALMQIATALGVQLRTGCSVKKINTESSNVIVEYECSATTMQLKASQVAVCTNAFAKELLPQLQLEPGRGQVIITKPIQRLAWKGIYHMQQGYDYARAINGRVLLGGGRHLDKTGETTTAMQPNEKIIIYLSNLLKEHLLPTTAFEIDYAWSGIMAFGNSKASIVEEIEPRVYAAVRCGGMGVAISSAMAKELSIIMLSAL